MDDDKKIKKIINFAQSIRQKTIIYSLELQNVINYQYSELVNKPLFSFCTTDNASVSKQFKRAFGKMTALEQALYYSKSLKTISDIISKKQQKISDKLINPQLDIQKLVVDIKREGSFKKWTTCKIQIAREFNIIRIIPTNEELDLQNYLMRNSKSKQKQAIVFQAIEDLAVPVSIKMTNKIGIFEDFRDKMQNYMDRAFTQKVLRLLRKNRISMTTDKSLRASITMPSMNLGNEAVTIALCSGTNPKSLRKMISQSTTRQQNIIDPTKIYSKLLDYETLYNLSNFKGYQQMEPGLFYNKKQNTTRKLFVFNQFDISYEWLVTNMNCYKTFKKWKPSLFLINLLAQISTERTKIYHQINLYKDYTQVDYVFLRHMFQMDKNHYYIDKSIWTQEYGTIQKHSNSRGLIDYALWRFRKIQNKIQILVQLKLSNIKTKNIWQIASEYVGDVELLQKQYKNAKDQKYLTSLSYKTVHNANLFLFQDESEINFDSIQNMGQSNKKSIQSKNTNNQKINNMQHQQQGQGLDFYERSRCETKFYTIYTSSSEEQNQIENSQQQESSNISNKSNMQEQIKKMTKKITEEYRQELKKVQPKVNINITEKNSKQLTNYKHIIFPLKKQQQQLRKSTKGHFLWQDQWKVTEKGQLININKAQSQAQSGVLKSVLGRMGRNLFSGKSILNISLPIQIFGTDTNLQRLCKCLAYAPRFIQKAVDLTDPIQRLKKVICCSIGYGLLYIQMQKPFNPILGETFQAIIDGCPLYGQQISHHPPISSIFFKGRGYTIYGNFQAKVQMGMNSASGINEGHLCVSFDQQNLNKKILKFNTPPGEISGLIYGQRKLTLIRKSYVLDVQNLLFAELCWGSIKKKNELSANNDYVQGRILKLKKTVQFQLLPKLKQNDFQKVLCNFKGRWTNKIFFQQKIVFDIQKDAPVLVNQYQSCLQSNCTKRQDLILRKQLRWQQAQSAKQKLQQLQRVDRKLRKKYQTKK